MILSVTGTGICGASTTPARLFGFFLSGVPGFFPVAALGGFGAVVLETKPSN